MSIFIAPVTSYKQYKQILEKLPDTTVRIVVYNVVFVDNFIKQRVDISSFIRWNIKNMPPEVLDCPVNAKSILNCSYVISSKFDEPTTKPDTGKEELTTKPATDEPTTKPSGNESETTAAPTGEQNTEAVENETPGTGDSAPVVLYLLLVFAAIMLISGTTVYEKKRMK